MGQWVLTWFNLGQCVGPLATDRGMAQEFFVLPKPQCLSVSQSLFSAQHQRKSLPSDSFLPLLRRAPSPRILGLSHCHARGLKFKRS